MRTSLAKLDIDDATRKLLMTGGIRDVEGILEADPDRLAVIVGTKDLAKKLTEMAKRLLGSTTPAAAPPAPAPSRAVPAAKKARSKGRK